jgi:hypothetical protein
LAAAAGAGGRCPLKFKWKGGRCLGNLGQWHARLVHFKKVVASLEKRNVSVPGAALLGHCCGLFPFVSLFAGTQDALNGLVTLELSFKSATFQASGVLVLFNIRGEGNLSSFGSEIQNGLGIVPKELQFLTSQFAGSRTGKFGGETDSFSMLFWPGGICQCFHQDSKLFGIRNNRIQLHCSSAHDVDVVIGYWGEFENSKCCVLLVCQKSNAKKFVGSTWFNEYSANELKELSRLTQVRLYEYSLLKPIKQSRF